jgi:hypothetical protein
MRRLYWVTGINSACIAKLYRINSHTVFDAVTYRTWPNLGDTFDPAQITRESSNE